MVILVTVVTLVAVVGYRVYLAGNSSQPLRETLTSLAPFAKVTFLELARFVTRCVYFITCWKYETQNCVLACGL
jgi:hypothetical protein